MRNLHLEASIWNLFTSTNFFEAAANECEETASWFGRLAMSRGLQNFGRNNQIFDTFREMARDFRRGIEMTKFDDYKLVWDSARSVRGHARGMLEQPLHSWMSETEYREFENIRMNSLRKYTGRIESALNNAMVKGQSFLHPNPDCPERSNDDDGYPDDDIIRWYQDYIKYFKRPLICKIPEPLKEYMVDRSIACRTGDEVPWTGVWYPDTGLEKHSLTFAIKGQRMQPVYRVIKTLEELRRENPGVGIGSPETIAVATTWHPVIPTGRTIDAETTQELRAKAGQPCPKAGIWQPMEPGAGTRRYETNEPMANLGSAYGITVWRWIADR
jgi:hypothetical protein